MAKITIEVLKSDARLKAIASEAVAQCGEGPWNAQRQVAALALIANALFPESEAKVKALCAIAAEHGLVINSSQFAQWASDVPKGAAGPRVAGIIRQKRGEKETADVASLLGELTADVEPTPPSK